MYVAVKGGEQAIEASLQLLRTRRRGNPGLPEIEVAQIQEQLGLAVDRVMTEGSLYDRELAALAIKQAQGDLMEAIFLLRAYRTTLPRLTATLPLQTESMTIRRRISAIFKDLPGGQILGPTYDYTHRLLDFSLLESAEAPTLEPAGKNSAVQAGPVPTFAHTLEHEDLLEPELPEDDQAVGDLTQDPLILPADRDVRLQNLARADEGFLNALAYSVQRGFGTNNHPLFGEIRMGEVGVEIIPPELGFSVEIGEITVTECQLVKKFNGSEEKAPGFTRGYGLTFGHCERKGMAMAIMDRTLRKDEFEEPQTIPAQDEEFVLMHSDNVEASGFVQHLKLPHYVDFQAELNQVRSMRRNRAESSDDP